VTSDATPEKTDAAVGLKTKRRNEAA